MFHEMLHADMPSDGPNRDFSAARAAHTRRRSRRSRTPSGAASRRAPRPALSSGTCRPTVSSARSTATTCTRSLARGWTCSHGRPPQILADPGACGRGLRGSRVRPGAADHSSFATPAAGRSEQLEQVGAWGSRSSATPRRSKRHSSPLDGSLRSESPAALEWFQDQDCLRLVPAADGSFRRREPLPGSRGATRCGC